MTKSPYSNLSGLLSADIPAEAVSLADWNLVIQQGRSAQVLGALYCRLRETEQLSTVPEPVCWHLQAANVVADKNHRDALNEVDLFLPIFRGLGIPLILLKGSAYVALGAGFSGGRVFSDLDILVPRDRLKDLEDALRWYGWTASYHSVYDQKYYRQWMHELPPLMHRKRRTVLDIHHTILPLTARLKPPAQKFFDNLNPVPAYEGVFTLSSVDMVLHAATHLFMDSEYDHAFRDLLDIDGLLRHFDDGSVQYWQNLLDRAEEMDLLPPLCYALHQVQRVFNTPMPPDMLANCAQKWRPTLPQSWMTAWFARIVSPHHKSCRVPGTGLAQTLFFLRGHGLRMPLGLLVYHLARKAFISPFEGQKEKASVAAK